MSVSEVYIQYIGHEDISNLQNSKLRYRLRFPMVAIYNLLIILANCCKYNLIFC